MEKATRGSGVLEKFLSKQRIKIAIENIPVEKYKGRVLDIGCGSKPLFLKRVSFNEKYGVDQIVTESDGGAVKLYKENILNIDKLHFKTEYFDVITLLAVIEHIYSNDAKKIIKEVRRLLKPGGLIIITTPAKWTDKLLKILSKINLVSKEEIEEHKNLFTQEKIKNILIEAGFKKGKIKTGTFELGMNLFAVAKK